MSRTKTANWTVADYDRAANAYQRRLPLEHYMEAVSQSTQRKITLASLDLLPRRRLDVQVFNELLIQYFFKGRLRRVVPDNMLRRSSEPLRADRSYNLELEGIGPFLVMEYVSPENYRKDYHESFHKYESELKVPYYLLFYPEEQDLQVHHLEADEYRRLPANAEGRYAIPELDLEVGLLDGWVRYWYQGELLPLPTEMEELLEGERRRADQERQRAEQEKQRADLEKQGREQAEAEVERLRALLQQTQEGKAGRRRPPKGKA
jgi:Uma2 family endonuclease